MTDFELSLAIEEALVSRNPRHMRTARAALQPGYYLRAASFLRDIKGAVVIGTGFPVADTFETDGPVGAIALYNALDTLGAEPWLACDPPLCDVIDADFRVLPLRDRDLDTATAMAREGLQRLRPAAVVCIERPGLCENRRYYNMRGEDITARSAFFDPWVTEASCPTIAVGDGGNEVGMGNIANTIAQLDIRGACTPCDELLVADVSNWGAYGLIALLARWSGQDLLAAIDPLDILEYLSRHGSVDGVTRENTLTEDGLHADQGLSVLRQLRQFTGFVVA